jgi:hypothetical protein
MTPALTNGDGVVVETINHIEPLQRNRLSGAAGIATYGKECGGAAVR